MIDKNNIIFYKHDNNAKSDSYLLSSDLSIEEHRPTLFKTNLHGSNHPINWLWFLVCNQNFRIFYVRNSEGHIVHYSTVKSKFFKFPYLKKDDIEIGPCWTDKTYRGKNIYPCVLNYILRVYQNSATGFYMFTDKSNIPSQKGMEKAGFKKIGEGRKGTLLGIYKIKNYYDSHIP